MRLLTIGMLLAALAPAAAQEGSLTYRGAAGAPPGAPTLESTSFIFQRLPPEALTRPLDKESIITVLVDYRTVMLSEGSGETRKTGSFSSVLTDWILFDGKSIFPDPQTRGDPTVGGTVNSQLRAESEVEQRESLTFDIACKVVDIRPNGNIVLEGWQEMQINEEVWSIYLSGTAPRQMIGPDWTVRDRSIANLRVKKYEKGSVQQGYSRGWLSRWYGKYKAF